MESLEIIGKHVTISLLKFPKHAWDAEGESADLCRKKICIFLEKLQKQYLVEFLNELPEESLNNTLIPMEIPGGYIQRISKGIPADIKKET